MRTSCARADVNRPKPEARGAKARGEDDVARRRLPFRSSALCHDHSDTTPRRCRLNIRYRVPACDCFRSGYVASNKMRPSRRTSVGSEFPRAVGQLDSIALRQAGGFDDKMAITLLRIYNAVVRQVEGTNGNPPRTT